MAHRKHRFLKDPHYDPNGYAVVRCQGCKAYGFWCPRCDSKGCRYCQGWGVQIQGTGYLCKVAGEVVISNPFIDHLEVDSVLVPASSPKEAAIKFRESFGRWPDTVECKAFQAPEPKQKVLLARMPPSYRKLIKTAGDLLASQIPEKLAWALVIGSKDSRFGGYISNANHADTIQALEDALDAIKQQNAGGRN